MSNINFSPEQDQYLQLSQTRAYYHGLREGMKLYAYWRDGIQYVGTTGKTLSQALDDINDQEQCLLQRYKIKEL